MKVVCVDNERGCEKHLTIGKSYDLLYKDKYYYTIIDDHGNIGGYYKEYFKSLSEIRNKKIDKLLK